MNCRARPLLGTFCVHPHRWRRRRGGRCFCGDREGSPADEPADPDSDLSRINRRAHRRPVEVHPWTYAVLRSAQAMSRASAGIFDITRRRYGARHERRRAHRGPPVRLRSRARLDLGGIAKGFAVDRASRRCRRMGPAKAA